MFNTDFILSMIAPAVALGLAVTFIRRNVYRTFPTFFAYLCYSVAAWIVRRAVSGQPGLYAWAYWATEILFAILALLVIIEVYRRLFPIEYEAYRWLRLLLASTICVILAFSCWEALKNPPEHGHIRQMVSFVYWFDVGVHALEGLLFLLLILLRVILPVAWRRYEFGILIGLGLPAAVTTIADLLRFEHGSSYEMLFRYAPPIAYILATIIWLHAFWKPPVPSTSSNTLEEMEDVLRRDREALKKLNENNRLAVGF
jgi:hypothetical protein